MITAPVTKRLETLLKVHGLDPLDHHQLVRDLMMYVYDEREQAVSEVLDTPHDRMREAAEALYDNSLDK